MTTATQVPARAEIPQEQTWNSESMFADTEAWQAEYEALSRAMPQLATFQGTLGESPENLANYMATASLLRRRLRSLYFYAAMRNSVDSQDEEAKPLIGQAMSLAGQYGKYSAFDQPELLTIGKEKLLGWVESHEALAIFRQYIEDLFRQQAHVRSAEVEEVLGMVQEPFSSANQVSTELTNTDFTFADAIDRDGKPFTVTQSSISMALNSPDRELRRTAWQNYADRYLEFKNTLSAAYSASVKQSTMVMRLRGYDSVLQMQLFPHNLPTEVFHNLIDTFKKNLPTWHRYWDVRRRALGLDTIQPWDIWAPLTQNEPSLSFEQSVEYIATALTPLGEDYAETLRRGCLEQRWVDWSVNKGKRQGAFSGGSYDSYPFIMMSYDHQLGGMSTLAHELGHSMHSYYTRKTQPEEYSGYSMFVAEVASNFNQAMTRAYLFENNSDRDFQLGLIQEAMDNFHRYFFIMPTLARFELEVHTRIAEGKPITADILNGIMRDLYAEGYGETMSDDPERTGITWATFGHLYIPYYTFQYATGISAANALAEMVRSGDAEQAANYRKFLAAGSSVYPLDALKIAGIDMTTPEPIEKAFGVLAGLVDRLESLIEE